MTSRRRFDAAGVSSRLVEAGPAGERVHLVLAGSGRRPTPTPSAEVERLLTGSLASLAAPGAPQ